MVIDLETLGKTPGTAVLSIGAVIFNMERIIDTKHLMLNLEEQVSKRKVDASTLLWWMGQSDKAKEIFGRAQFGSIQSKVCASFIDFYKTNNTGNGTVVWGNGASFDIPIMESLLLESGHEPPWKFWDIRCYRTVNKAHDIERGRTRSGTKHDALDDATFQATCLQAFFALAPEYDV